jgi:hypothetical protein
MCHSPCQSLVLAAALWSGGLIAQTPENPPPWWRVQDNVTVSLYWDFNTPFANGTFPPPTLVVAPPWYNPAVTQGVATANLRYVASLGGFNGVCGVTSAGGPVSADLDLTVDNDPYPDWVKLFWFQYDEFEGAAGSIRAAIEESLGYKRAIISEKSVALGGGWNRVTVEAQLIPQPDDEGIDFSFLLSAAGAIGIDNLYVNSKCEKPPPDETGDALGDVDRRTDLDAVTGAADCRAAAVVEGPGPTFAREYWVVATAALAGTPHRLLRLGGSPPTSVVATFPLPATTITAPQGPGDIAVERATTTGGQATSIVWAIVDNRAAGGAVTLAGVNAATGAATALALAGFPPPSIVPTNQMLGLAFEPSGEFGLGTFWVSSTDANGQGALREFSRNPASPGALLDVRAIEPQCTGLAYDDSLGNFYAFSRRVQATPSQPIQAHGYEISGYDFAATGVRFCSDLTLPNGAGPRGGLARGLEVWRSRSQTTAALSLVCVVDTPGNAATSRSLVELAGPFAFGWSVLGRCGMADVGTFRGLPFLGSSFEVTLRGVPNSPFAMLWLGFSNTTSAAGPLPLPVGGLLGWPESTLSVSPDLNSPLLTPSAPGEFRFAFPVPSNAALGYTPLYFQWLALDSGINGFFALTQAGKTVLYP